MVTINNYHFIFFQIIRNFLLFPENNIEWICLSRDEQFASLVDHTMSVTFARNHVLLNGSHKSSERNRRLQTSFRE